MNLRGHIGFTLIMLSSILILLELKGIQYVKIAIFSAMLSSLPDIDLKIKLPHRKYTHNLLFVVFTAYLFGYLTSLFLNDFSLGFYSSIASGIAHLLGDLMTYMGFTPFYPLSDRIIALRFFKSNNVIVNNFFLFVGIFLFLFYIKFCYNL